MLAKRIIACLDVANAKVVKGIRFKDHEIIADTVELAKKYSYDGIDELVLYDILASISDKTIDVKWIENIAKVINIPFCVAGKIDTITKAKAILNAGAEKISINSPALDNPDLINELVCEFGSSAVVVGIDTKNGFVYKYTGNIAKTEQVAVSALDWAKEVAERGAGEIVINSMNFDGVKNGYDIELLKQICKVVNIPVIASGGCGNMQHFLEVFEQTNVSGALAASVFHKNILLISQIKQFLFQNNICVRT